MNSSMIPTGQGSSVSPRELTRQLEGEIAIVREELSQLVAELDRRRHEAFDVRLQVKRHAPEMLISGGALIAAAAGFVWFRAWRSRRPPRLRSQVHQTREKLMTLVQRKSTSPESPRMITSILTSAANAAVAVGDQEAGRTRTSLAAEPTNGLGWEIRSRVHTATSGPPCRTVKLKAEQTRRTPSGRTAHLPTARLGIATLSFVEPTLVEPDGSVLAPPPSPSRAVRSCSRYIPSLPADKRWPGALQTGRGAGAHPSPHRRQRRWRRIAICRRHLGNAGLTRCAEQAGAWGPWASR